MKYIIGIDFDNTLVSYEQVIYKVAEQQGLNICGTNKSKKNIRDSIRLLPNGEIEWQKLQAIVYGPRMGEAKLIDGVKEFLSLCKQNNIKVYIVSHKTEYARFDQTKTNLRKAALSWMGKNGFFEDDGLGLSKENVYFEATRIEKIERIRYLACTHFIDDLEELFLELSFPAGIVKVLFAPDKLSLAGEISDVRLYNTWNDIGSYLFYGTKS